MIRYCDGTDDNLYREITEAQFDPDRYTLSGWDRAHAPGVRLVRCDCGLEFDDVERMTTWPHEMLGSRRN